jgi:dipeptidyl aminopeptidase/acylaminoacyl peptidase
MTSDRRFEHDLPDLLADLYLGPPPDYRDDILQLVARTPQRPAWTFLERWLPMSVVALARQAMQPLPWRSIGLLAMISLLLVAAMALYAGSQERRLPAPFGPAANGALVVGEGGDIVLIDPVTGTKTVAVGGAAIDSLPAYSRDGTHIAFYRNDFGEVTLWLVDSRGGSPRPLSTAGLAEPTDIIWSPDGHSILVNAVVASTRVMAIVPVDGTAPRVIDVGMPAENPTWLPPSGAEIVFRGTTPSGFGLFAVRPDGTGGVRPIVAATGQSEYDALFLAPSPDGRAIAYQWRDVDNIQKLFVVPTSGGAARELTSIESTRLAWSPDGAWIAFWGNNFVTHVIPADGPGAPQVACDGSAGFRWAPDGQRLACAASSGRVVLFDPRTGLSADAGFTAFEVPDWQRLAPAP